MGMKKKTALITGVAGQDGSYMADFLCEKEYNVIGVIRRNATRDLGNAKHLDGVVDIVEGDITDASSMLRLIEDVRPHEIYNLAAQSHVHTSFEQPLAAVDINMKGLINILEVARCLRPQTRIFHASTSEMFGSSPAPQNIETELVPESPYAIAKVASHHFIRLYRKAYKMYCCAGVTFNHECFFAETPVILRKNGEINIVYISSLVQNRKNINKDSSKLTKEYEGTGTEIWDGENFVELRAVSRCKLTTLEDVDRKRKVTNVPAGSISTTPNHRLINQDGEKLPARMFIEDQEVMLGKMPEGPYCPNKASLPGFAKLLGLLCGDGHVSKSIRLTNGDPEIQKEFVALASNHYCNVSHRTSTYPSGFDGTTSHVDLTGVSKAQIQVLREMLYDVKTGHKKVPQLILNSSQDVQLAFLKGYNLADGLKCGNETYELASFKTNSPLLAQGLLYLITCTTGQSFNINTFEQRGRFYTQVNLHSPSNPHGFGSHFVKEPSVVKKSLTIPEDNQHVYDIETATGKVMAGIGIMIVGNSERRGPLFVTRKISMGVAKCLQDPNYVLELGNLDAKRDWGYAPDFVEGFWMCLQQERPDDYVFATNEMHSVREFCEVAFDYVGLDWKDHVKVNRFYMRPSEVDELCGDYSKTTEALGWKPKVTFEELVKRMVDYDCKLLGVQTPDPEPLI
jgi:GDPmannose 4,6-dehydratase